METVTLLNLYIDNTKDIYRLTEWLCTAIAKKMKKGLVPDMEVLANCSTMKRIVGMAAKMVLEEEGRKVTVKDRKEAAKIHAADILYNAAYLASGK